MRVSRRLSTWAWAGISAVGLCCGGEFQGALVVAEPDGSGAAGTVWGPVAPARQADLGFSSAKKWGRGHPGPVDSGAGGGAASGGGSGGGVASGGGSGGGSADAGTKPDAGAVVDGGALVPSIFVAPGGLDSNAGTQSRPVATLQHGADLAGVNGHVYVRGGTYSPTSGTAIKLGPSHNGIVVEAFPGETPVVSVAGLPIWVTSGSQHITVRGLRFERTAAGSVAELFGNDMLIESCEFTNHNVGQSNIMCGEDGVPASVNAVFRKNRVHHMGPLFWGVHEFHGLYLQNTKGWLIENNKIDHCGGGYGIQLWATGQDGVQNTTIRRNVIYANRGGIIVGADSTGGPASNNVFTRNIVIGTDPGFTAYDTTLDYFTGPGLPTTTLTAPVTFPAGTVPVSNGGQYYPGIGNTTGTTGVGSFFIVSGGQRSAVFTNAGVTATALTGVSGGAGSWPAGALVVPVGQLRYGAFKDYWVGAGTGNSMADNIFWGNRTTDFADGSPTTADARGAYYEDLSYSHWLQGSRAAMKAANLFVDPALVDALNGDLRSSAYPGYGVDW